MKVVIDASCAMEVILNRDRAPEFKEAIGRAGASFAPDLLFPEVVNSLWKEHEFAGLSLTICEEALGILEDLVDTVVPSGELFKDAFALSRTLGKSAYDMFYLALARREGAALLTLDKGLRKEAKRHGIRVV